MIIYSYRCDVCGELSDFRRELDSTDEPDACRRVIPFDGTIRQDPVCGGLLVRNYTAPALIGCKP